MAHYVTEDVVWALCSPPFEAEGRRYDTEACGTASDVRGYGLPPVSFGLPFLLDTATRSKRWRIRVHSRLPKTHPNAI